MLLATDPIFKSDIILVQPCDWPATYSLPESVVKPVQHLTRNSLKETIRSCGLRDNIKLHGENLGKILLDFRLPNTTLVERSLSALQYQTCRSLPYVTFMLPIHCIKPQSLYMHSISYCTITCSSSKGKETFLNVLPCSSILKGKYIISFVYISYVVSCSSLSQLRSKLLSLYILVIL